MIPVNPQPLDVLIKRFPEALKKSWSVSRVMEDPNERPGAKPENVFDFEDGIRLIVSRDHFKGKEVIHFSASKNLVVDLSGKTATEIREIIMSNMRNLIGKDIDPIFITVSTEGIPHWYIEHVINN